MNDDEEFLFQQEMADVEPLKTESRVKLRRDAAGGESLEQRRAAAVAEPGDLNPLSDEGIAPLDSWYVLGLRTVLVIHGKGENSGGQEREQASIIKGCVDKWLRELEPVQAFHSAKARHGGTDAVYILLRKGDDARKDNRERVRQ